MRNGWPAALSRPGVLDVAAGLASIGLDILLTSAGWDNGWPLLVSIVVGAPMAMLRRWPTAVAGYLAVLLFVCDRLGSFSGNTVQILLTIALAVVARWCPWRWILPVALLAAVGNALKLAHPENVVQPWSWLLPVAFTVGPVVMGRYLRARAGHSEVTREPADLLLAAAGATLAVLGTWPFWASGPLPVPAAGLLVVGAGLALGVARRRPGAVLLESAVALALPGLDRRHVPGTGERPARRPAGHRRPRELDLAIVELDRAHASPMHPPEVGLSLQSVALLIEGLMVVLTRA